MIKTFISLTIITIVNGHSWLECVDYDMSIDMQANNFDNQFHLDSCGGFPRNYWEWGHRDFGAKPGIDHQLFEDGNTICDIETSIGNPNNNYASSYTNDFPMANYDVGESYRLIWPAKNHAAAAACDERELDNAMKLFVNLVPYPTSDPGNGGGELAGNGLLNDGWTLVIDWHEASGENFVVSWDGISTYAIEGVPFSNCPKFCENKDKSVCYGDVTIPDIFPESGIYTFLWYWELGWDEPYTHCYEAFVNVPSNTQTDPPEPCSCNGNVGGNVVPQNTETPQQTDTASDAKGSNTNKESSCDDSSLITILILIIVGLVLFIIVSVIYFVCKNRGNNDKNIDKENVFANVVNTQQTNTQAITAVNDDDDHPGDGINYATGVGGKRPRPPPRAPVIN